MAWGKRVREEARLIVELVAKIQIVRILDGTNAVVGHEKSYLIFHLKNMNMIK
jgi:hypothetical protein